MGTIQGYIRCRVWSFELPKVRVTFKGPHVKDYCTFPHTTDNIIAFWGLFWCPLFSLGNFHMKPY